ncbi:MAG: hypothetical protein ABTD50_22130 [Polyangiaceae bacterium]
MLRISSNVTTSGITSLLLEGSLAGPWVDALRDALNGCDGNVELDLSAVRFVDAEGAALLRSVLGKRVTLCRSSAFVASLLGESNQGKRC